MAIEDMRERLLDAEAVLKLCNPSIKLSFKPIKKHGRFHYLVRRDHGSKQQTRFSSKSFDTIREAESLKSKVDYAECLVSTQLAVQKAKGNFFTPTITF